MIEDIFMNDTLQIKVDADEHTVLIYHRLDRYAVWALHQIQFGLPPQPSPAAPWDRLRMWRHLFRAD